MANLGAFFSKPGLLPPPPKKQQIVSVTQSLQAATLLQLHSDIDKKHHKKSHHSHDDDLEEQRALEALEKQEAEIKEKKANLRKKLAKKQQQRREEEEVRQRELARITREKALQKYKRAHEERSSDEEDQSDGDQQREVRKIAYTKDQMNDKFFRIQPSGDDSRFQRSPAEATGNLMHGPKSDSFAFHISRADGSEYTARKHAKGFRRQRTRKENPKANVVESFEEKTWQPVSAV
jgi:hypothetical protein